MPTLKDELASLKIDRSERAGGARAGAWGLLALLVLVLAGGVWFWMNRTRPAEVRTATVIARTGAATPDAVLNASGYVTARRRATVSSKVTGKVLEVNLEEGQAVRRGQVLARLDDAQVRASLNVVQAQLAAARGAAAEDEARLREARLTFDRRTQLLKEGVVNRAEVDTAGAQVESLEARIALAHQQVLVSESLVRQRQTDLDDMVVRAPFDGVAISKDAQPGEMISPVSAGGGFTRTGIGTIVDMSSLEVEVDVSENYINRVKAGQPVEAVLDAYPDWTIPANVITTVPSADRQRATVRVRIGFEQLDPRMLPDMGVKVRFLAERAPAADPAARARMLIPAAAIQPDGERHIVFVLRGEVVERRAVTVGSAEGDRVEVLSGLTDGERVVIDAPSTLADGARVTVKER
ncbi:MAG: efflux RND transporter periplasmic adaptor subunit [Acidobacteria bacterium]|nr:efflux RND transporter periplasmic adaptor subunit [Acidobacteriota bacterium]